MRDITTQVWWVQKKMYLTVWTCEEDIHRANMIGELVQVRDGQLHLSISQCEVRALIEYVCTRYIYKCRTIDKEHCF